MTFLQSLILGLIQAVTEFLPISSDGHLNLFQNLLGLSPSLNFDIFLNTATLFSVLFFFRKDWRKFLTLLPYIFLGSIPAGIIGVFFKDRIEELAGNPSLLPYFFLYTSVLVFLTRFYQKQKGDRLNWKIALIVGAFQSLAILPGVSRSASTIFSGLLMGLSPAAAFSFSFFLFIPASLGALLLSLFDSGFTSLLDWQLLPSFLFSSVVGFFMLFLLARIIKTNRFWMFSIYTFVLGVFLFFYY